MGHVRSKTMSLGQILENSCVCFKDRIFGLILLNLFASMKSCTFFKLGHVGENRSLVQIIEDPVFVTKGL